MSEDINGKRHTFFTLVFGRSSGYVCLAFLSKEHRKDFREEYFQYPEELPKLLEAINRSYAGYNVYFCPQLLSEKVRKKHAVAATTCAWADLDTCEPDVVEITPSVSIESSPGRYQAYWTFDRHVDPEDAEDISRRIAYKYADDGADRSGWDLTQLLRVPYTYNYKHATPNNPEVPIVKVIDNNGAMYRFDDFKILPQIAGYQYLDIEMPDEVELPDPDEILQARRNAMNPLIWGLYGEPPPEKDWSKPLWQLQMLLFEAGYDRNAVFAIARKSQCNKYARDGRSDILLWKEVCRAFAKNEANNNLFISRDPSLDPLLTEEEKELIRQQPDSFVERYSAWARALGDAAPQYHQAGAFIALSSLIGGAVRLPTSFGTVIPNLWFMILADTTLTRKTTAMDIAMDMVTEIDDGTIMATDGSIEGLLTSLSTRPGIPSVFLRDEFSGLLEQMTKKDYMAGMPELLTKLYDGKMQKRILRKEVIEVRDPILIIFAGGIKNKVTGSLTFDQVSSGFMPRFVFITAESDISRVKPLGPPTMITNNNRDAIRNELNDLYAHYRTPATIHIEKLKTKAKMARQFDAQLTPEAWERYNVMETQMLQAGLATDRADVMTPTYDRLSKSILKASVLLAASRQREDTVTVEVIDLLRAMLYGEEWRVFVNEVMQSVGKGTIERELDKIYNAIVRKPGVTRSFLMQSYHLTSREASAIFETLSDRGLITVQKRGRGFAYYSTETGI